MGRRPFSIIFRKELVDILRDRRTLIAMVVVPMVLYPVLMLGSIQAAQFQVGKLQREKIRIGVPDERTGHWLAAQLEAAGDSEKPASAPASTPANDENAQDIEEREFDILIAPDVRAAVRGGAIHVGLILREDFHPRARWAIDPPFTLCYDSAEIRSEMARSHLERMLDRRREQIRSAELESLLPRSRLDLIAPRPIASENVASPEKVGGSLLGHVLPLILVLMTITGGIYPAIDLTAGERERGTLETLMVAPVRVIDLIVGKFLVVAAVSLIAAVLNLTSIGLTLHFGDVQELLARGQQASIPLRVLPLILVAMVPLAILFSAALIAVASFARTFKEAQNYVMPVIMATLIPGTAAALPGVELQGVMTVLPVANMVLLTRELLLGHFSLWPQMLVALASTSLYAVVAVVVAARLFGQEAVLFADAGSWKNLFRRRLFERRPLPSAAHALLAATLLFPIWFHVQGQLGTHIGVSAGLIGVFFGGLPLWLAVYLKIDLRETFSFRAGRVIHWLGAVAIGLGSWAVAYELLVLQGKVLPMPPGMSEADQGFADLLAGWPLPLLLLALAVVPGVCEELMFRGFVLGGLRSGVRPAWAILASAVLFAAFHFLVVRFGVTAVLGIVLGFVCWRSRSIFPGMLIHIMHNASVFVLHRWDIVAKRFGLDALDGAHHLPTPVWIAAVIAVLVGILVIGATPIRTSRINEANG